MLSELALARLSPVAGAEVTGIDLARPLTPALKDAILRAFLAHHVLVFRGQSLDRPQQLAFTLQFGEVEDQHVGRLHDADRYTIVHTVSNLDRDGRPSTAMTKGGNYHWHTDKSYHAAPSLLTMLHAVELPSGGGDTQFANMVLAYAALPDAMRARLAGMRAVHSWAASRRRSGSPPPSEAEMRERPPVEHPLVRTHPETGAKALYIGNHVSHVVGLPPEESEALLEALLAHATEPRFVFTQTWRPGDLVMWDNRCLLHRAVANYAVEAERRVLHRTVVRGTVPF
jgi:alpha-ketoglutarate-dependent taurine dioxygenase